MASLEEIRRQHPIADEDRDEYDRAYAEADLDGKITELVYVLRTAADLIERLESARETLEILSDPELVAALREGLADVAAGRVQDMDEVVSELQAAGRLSPLYAKPADAPDEPR